MEKYEKYWEEFIYPNNHRYNNFKSCITRNPSREIVYRIVEDHGFKTLLDVGCGLADDYKYCKAVGTEYSGIDITKGFIKDVKDKNPEIDVQVGRIQNLPFDDNSKDVIIVRHVFEHLPDIELAFEEITRVAKHMILISWFLVPGEKEEIVLFEKGFGGKVYRNIYSEKRVMDNLKKNKLSLEEKMIVDVDDGSGTNYSELWVCKK